MTNVFQVRFPGGGDDRIVDGFAKAMEYAYLTLSGNTRITARLKTAAFQPDLKRIGMAGSYPEALWHEMRSIGLPEYLEIVEHDPEAPLAHDSAVWRIDLASDMTPSFAVQSRLLDAADDERDVDEHVAELFEDCLRAVDAAGFGSSAAARREWIAKADRLLSSGAAPVAMDVPAEEALRRVQADAEIAFREAMEKAWPEEAPAP